MKTTSTIIKASKLFMLVSLIVLTAAMLTACSVFNYIFKTSDENKVGITSVSISVQDGLNEGGDNYYAALGEAFSLKANVNEGAPSSITYVWLVGKSGEEATAIQGENGDILNYTIEEYSAESYIFSVTANDVPCSQTMQVYTSYANLNNVYISSTTDRVLEGVIQRKIVQTAPITFKANWNAQYMDPEKSALCTFEWRIGTSPTVLSTDNEFSVEQPTTEGDLTIKLTIKEGTAIKNASVILSVVNRFFAASKISLSVSAEAVSDGNGQYVQTTSSPESPFSAVTLSASVAPVGTDNSAEVRWTVRNRSGISTLGGTSRELSFTPSYGENYVTATIDNIVSDELNIIAMTGTDYNSHKEEIDDVFVWDNGVYNHYISDQTDLNVLVSYIISRHETAVSASDSTAHSIYVAKTEWKDGGGNGTTAFSEAIGTAMSASDESGYFPFNYSTSVIYIVPSSGGMNAAFGNPSVNYASTYTVTQFDNVITHFSESIEERTILPVDTASNTLTVKNSDQLYRAVGWGYKPVFENNAQGNKLQTLYGKARAVLCDIIDDNMSEFEKVRAICEWISQEVDYDYSTAESTASIAEKVTYNAFYLEGVFDDNKAVCDGRSKAFMLLCGMEGIESVRITGEAITPQSSTPVGHAWNKVLIDVEDSGVKEWYLVDTTWSDRGMTTLENEKSELLTMQYFLVTDSYTSSTHDAESAIDPVADTVFNYYTGVKIENGDNDFDLYINSENELKNAVLYSKTNGVRLDIKVSSSVASTESMLKDKIGLILIANGGGTRVLVTLDASGGYYNLYIMT